VKRALLLPLLLLAVLVLPAGASAKPDPFPVVAVENFWGSIAAQLAGDRASVQSVITNPGTDPHSYEPTPSDARTLAIAKVVIVNGLGYDTWASQLLDANPYGGRVVVDAGDVLGLKQGDNPHQWYSPTSVRTMVEAIVVAFDRVDPAGRSYFAARQRVFEQNALARYDTLRAQIRRRFAGMPVGYSESIFEPLGTSLGLKLITPPGLAKAVAEGNEVSASDKRTVERQLRRHEVRVWIYNSQNVTPDVEQFTSLARAEHIPVVTITETLSPENETFQQWQADQLAALLRALRR
jgi:zinc/manganese transport system substrate-binding protein